MGLEPGLGERETDLVDDRVVAHLAGREVHRDQEVLLVRRLGDPAGGLPAGVVEDELADLGDQSALLGER